MLPKDNRTSLLTTERTILAALVGYDLMTARVDFLIPTLEQKLSQNNDDIGEEFKTAKDISSPPQQETLLRSITMKALKNLKKKSKSRSILKRKSNQSLVRKKS